MGRRAEHQSKRSALERADLDNGVVDGDARRRAREGRPGDPAAAAVDDVVRQVREQSADVTDSQVARLRAAVGSDRAAFEVILATSVGAGLDRWDAALAAIDGGSDPHEAG